MRKATIKHENLKRYISEFHRMGGDPNDEYIDMIGWEILHSCLITPSTKDGDWVDAKTAKTPFGEFAAGFTDMAEFRKAFPDFTQQANEFPIEFYCKLVKEKNLDGLIVNIKGEMFIMPADAMEDFVYIPMSLFPSENALSGEELKGIKDSIDNENLERFIQNPENQYKYGQILDKIAKSTLLTLMVSRNDLKDCAKDGIVRNDPDDPKGFLYTKKMGGEYATVYTSEDKIRLADTDLYRYSQVVNFAQMVNFILNDDMDGIIINPNGENIIITRYVLMQYYMAIEEECYDERLNESIFYMFEMEEDI